MEKCQKLKRGDRRLVVVITKKGIKLPYVGKEKFAELMRVGLRYDKQTRMFRIEKTEYLEQIKNVLTEILKEPITFAQTCIICGREFPCTECPYEKICRSKDFPSYCICKNCLGKPELYRLYLEKSGKLVGL